MTQSPYFDYGYAAHGQSQLALYEPVMGSFLLILDDLDVARHVKILTSSRYQLLICCLDPVIQGQENLIDNACCERWCIPEDQFDLGTIIKQLDPLVLSQMLPQHSPDPQVYAEKSWLHMVWHWSKFMRYLKNDDGWYDLLSITESFLPMLDSIANLEVTKFCIMINQYIYFGRDRDQTDNQCRDCLRNFPTIEFHYQQWIKPRS
jgi:hypothetical protein